MATYYVDYVNGLDANNGLGPDASDSTNKPWKTIAKLLGASGMASGDTAYLSPAGPFREVVTVAMTSATAETKVLGDPANAQGFKTSGGVRVAPGEVVWTAYTTNDTTAPSSSVLLTLSGRDYLTFEKITFVNGSSYLVDGSSATSTNITFRDSSLLANLGAGSQNVVITVGFGVQAQWLIERCILRGSLNCLRITLNSSSSGADYDANIVVRNCLLTNNVANYVAYIDGSGANTYLGGGVYLYNCHLLTTRGDASVYASGNTSTTYPIVVRNCFTVGGLSAAVAGQMTSDYNHICAATTYSNVTGGANDKTNTTYAQLMSLGGEHLWGATPRPFGSPRAGDPHLGFGNDGTYTSSEDIMGIPRPSGGASASKAIGAYERGNTFAKETGTVRTGSNAISITGPGTQDFQLPVDATSTTVTCYVRWDATYAGTKPQMKVLNCEEAGVTAASTTATGSSGAWEQLSLNFTPTRAGIVTIRLQSNDTNGAGKMFADDLAAR